jgi:hypothetical protein
MTEPHTGDMPARLREAGEVHIRTLGTDGAPHRTIVWVVVDERDRVLVRSYRGPNARWYREATSGRPASLELDGAVLPLHVERAVDPERIETTSRLLAAKYVDEAETPAMLRDDVLETTLELRLADRA